LSTRPVTPKSVDELREHSTAPATAQVQIQRQERATAHSFVQRMHFLRKLEKGSRSKMELILVPD